MFSVVNENTPSVKALFYHGLVKVIGKPEKIEAFSKYIFNKLFRKKVLRTYFSVVELQPTKAEIAAFSDCYSELLIDLPEKLLRHGSMLGDEPDIPEAILAIDRTRALIIAKLFSLIGRLVDLKKRKPDWLIIIEDEFYPFLMSKAGIVIVEHEFLKDFTADLSSKFIDVFGQQFSKNIPLYCLDLSHQVRVEAIVATEEGTAKNALLDVPYDENTFENIYHTIYHTLESSEQFLMCDNCFTLIAYDEIEKVGNHHFCKNSGCDEVTIQSEFINDVPEILNKPREHEITVGFGVDHTPFYIKEWHWNGSHDGEYVERHIFSAIGSPSDIDTQQITQYLLEHFEFTTFCPVCWTDKYSWHMSGMICGSCDSYGLRSVH